MWVCIRTLLCLYVIRTLFIHVGVFRKINVTDTPHSLPGYSVILCTMHIKGRVSGKSNVVYSLKRALYLWVLQAWAAFAPDLIEMLAAFDSYRHENWNLIGEFLLSFEKIIVRLYHWDTWTNMTCPLDTTDNTVFYHMISK